MQDVSDNQVTEIDMERETTSKNRLNYRNVTDRLSIWLLNVEAEKKIVRNQKSMDQMKNPTH